MSTIHEIIETIETRREALATLGYRVRIDLKDEGAILIDATGPALSIAETDENADAGTVIRLSPDNMRKLLEGRLNPMLAYTLGQLKISGSQGVALKLSSLLGKG